VGLSDSPISDALACTASGVRPSFKPATRVGVFCFASVLSWAKSCGVHDLPWLEGFLAMTITPEKVEIAYQALCDLGLSLVATSHNWTNRQRKAKHGNVQSARCVHWQTLTFSLRGAETDGEAGWWSVPLEAIVSRRWEATLVARWLLQQHQSLQHPLRMTIWVTWSQRRVLLSLSS